MGLAVVCPLLDGVVLFDQPARDYRCGTPDAETYRVFDSEHSIKSSSGLYGREDNWVSVVFIRVGEGGTGG